MSYNVVLENKSLDDLIDIIYPVGSVYISVTSTNPKVLFGGEWTQIKDTFLLACGNSYANGATGGEANHTLTANEIPSHRHTVQHYYGVDTGYVPASSTAGSVAVRTDTIGISNTGGTFTDRSSGDYRSTNLIGYTGGSQAHNNMPPYLAVYMWKRIS